MAWWCAELSVPLEAAALQAQHAVTAMWGYIKLLLTLLKALLQVCLLALVVEGVDEADLLHLARFIACLGPDAADVRCTQQLAALVLVCTCCGCAAFLFLEATQGQQRAGKQQQWPQPVVSNMLARWA
jgi:hypothetical protein